MDNSQDSITYSCVRALLMLFNVMFGFAGLFLAYLSVWMRVDNNNYFKVSANYWENAPFVFIPISIVMLFVSLYACGCVLKTETSMLFLYTAFLITMLYVLVSASAFIYNYNGQLIEGLSTGLQREMNLKYNPKSGQTNPNTTLIDFIQRDLQCCGNESYMDWTTYMLPGSCCSSVDDESRCSANAGSVNSIGCYYKLVSRIQTSLLSAGIITSGIACLPLFGAILAFTLALLSKSDSELFRKSGYEEL